jgi:hypothetical protein
MHPAPDRKKYGTKDQRKKPNKCKSHCNNIENALFSKHNLDEKLAGNTQYEPPLIIKKQTSQQKNHHWWCGITCKKSSVKDCKDQETNRYRDMY